MPVLEGTGTVMMDSPETMIHNVTHCNTSSAGPLPVPEVGAARFSILRKLHITDTICI